VSLYDTILKGEFDIILGSELDTIPKCRFKSN